MSNVKSIAETILFVQRNGFKTVESIDDEISKTKKEYSEMNRQLSESKKHLRELNETIYYMGQYLSNKSIYQSYIKNSRKTEFKKVHKDELGKYSKAIIYLRTQYSNRPFPELNSLKEERKGVSSEINECYRRKNTIKGKYFFLGFLIKRQALPIHFPYFSTFSTHVWKIWNCAVRAYIE